MTRKQVYKQYDMSDVEAVFRRGDWRDWAQIRRWLEREGEADNELTPGEVHHMGEDIASLHELGLPFVTNPAKAYQLMRDHCTHGPGH